MLVQPPATGDLCTTASGTSDRDIWVACDGSYALHLDGQTWRVLPTAMTFAETLWSFSPTDVWAVGSGGSHYDGVAFTPVPELAMGGRDIWVSAQT